MAVLYVTEYTQLMPSPPGAQGSLPMEPPLVEQTVAIGAGSVQSAVFNAKTRLIRLNCDVACSVLVGTNPTATATSGRMSIGQTEYRGIPVNIGSTFRVAVITNS